MAIDHFLPHTPEERQDMLSAVGFGSVIELMKAAVPEALWTKDDLKLPEAISESQALELAQRLSALNRSDLTVFLGGGAYDAYTPSIVDSIISRSEFYTAYTPYQAEVSQGTLQSMYEFQSLVCQLTEMEVSNASVYDGASGLAEAVLMAFRVKRNHTIALPKSLNPYYKATVETYIHGVVDQVLFYGYDESTGQVDTQDLERVLQQKPAAVVVQSPNHFGVIEDMGALADKIHESGALLISVFEPTSLGIIAPPGQYGADIAVAEAQGLGLPLSFGGPYLGLFTAKKQFIRQMPGRIVGMTQDVEGNRGFVTTLQTREQHIRRAKATSNICSNQQLIALAVSVFLSAMGKKGIQDIAQQSTQKAHYLAEKLKEVPGISMAFTGPFYREFTVFHDKLSADQVIKALAEKGFVVGPALPEICEYSFNIAITEKRTKQELDALVQALKEL